MIAVPVLELLNFNTRLVLPPDASETMLSVTYGVPSGAAQVVTPEALSSLALALSPRASSESGPGIAIALVLVSVIVCVY